MKESNSFKHCKNSWIKHVTRYVKKEQVLHLTRLYNLAWFVRAIENSVHKNNSFKQYLTKSLKLCVCNGNVKNEFHFMADTGKH